MLVLGVREGEYIMIDDNIKIRVLRAGETFKLAIDAPKEMTILRKRLYEQSNPQVAESGFRRIPATSL